MAELQNHKSVAGSDVEIVGSISFQGELIFDGKLKGGGIKGHVLTVGAGARVEGSIEADALTVSGAVTGDVSVAGKCELKSSAEVLGNLNTSRLMMADGATLIGYAQIRPAGASPSAAPPARK